MLAYLQRNAIALLALFVALGGTSAYAIDTIRSADIVDGEVKNADLGASAVTSAKIGSNAVNSGKLLDGGIAGADIGSNQITGNKVSDNTLSGSDINESLLGQVPDAARINGRVPDAYGSFTLAQTATTSSCAPTTNTWFHCAPITIAVPSGRSYRITVTSTVNAATQFTQSARICAASAGPTCLEAFGLADSATFVGGQSTHASSTRTVVRDGPTTFVAGTGVKFPQPVFNSIEAKTTTKVDVTDVSGEVPR